MAARHWVLRPYRSAADLRAMQDELVRSFATTSNRIGNVAWEARPHTHYELARIITLAFDGDDLAGWVWLGTSGGFNLYLSPEHRDCSERWDELIVTLIDQAQARVTAGDALAEIGGWFVEATDTVRPLLLARGFSEVDCSGSDDLLRADLSEIREAALPDGYRFDWVRDEATLAERVEVHRAAFAPSELTLGAYRRAQATWPYRPELDRVVRNSDDRVVAGATAWLDAENQAGLLESIGVLPDHHNRGIGRAITADAMGALRDAGATQAQLGISGPAARAAYLAAGFRPWQRERTFTRPLTPG